MNSEVQKRKKRFWAFCLVFVLMMGSVMPMLALGAEYSPGDLTDDPENEIGKVNIVNAGDKIAMPSLDGYVYYYTEDRGSQEFYAVAPDSSYEVKSYTDVFGGSSEGKGWKIDENYSNYGSGWYSLKLVEYNYTQSEIHYVLDGGENAATNPSTYYEGKEEILLADAGKEGYRFDGWYSDADFTTRVTVISKSQTGTVTLYAKFTAKTYNIIYNLDGGTNGAGNPASYTYGTGVAGFADASKEGYTFGGWYSDAAYTTKVTSISATQTGDMTLYAKFISDGDKTPINYEMLDGANSRWKHGSSENLTFRGSGDFSKFTGVKVDGNPVDSSNYSAEEGSTIITMKASYLNTLTIETHSIEILWTDGSAATSFTIYEDPSEEGQKGHKDHKDDDDDNDSDTPSEDKALPSDTYKKDDVPKTGDSTPIVWLFVLVGLSGAGLILTGKKGKKNLKALRK